VKNARILGNGKIGAERQFLEDATNPELLCKHHRIALPRLSADDDSPFVGGERAGQDMHQRRFARTVMAHKPNTFSDVDSEINPGKRADGAEMLFDAVQSDDIYGCPGDHTR
jgi:hypothetical protein